METVRQPVALVTGGSRGIGAATALALADHGYNVAITYRNKAARANEVAAEITRRGVRALAVGCDITQSEDVDRLFATLSEWSGHLNLLVLNAAGGLERDLVAADPDYPAMAEVDDPVAREERLLLAERVAIVGRDAKVDAVSLDSARPIK